MKIALVSLYDEYCLGPRYLSSVFSEDGHETHIITLKGLDYVGPHFVPSPENQDADGYYGFCSFVTGKETQLFLKLLEKIDPSWIGFSFHSINFGLAHFLSEAARSRFPNRPIIWGGIDTTVNPDENIQYCDIACLGEGELAMREFNHRFARGEDYSDIPSLWINKGNGEIIKNVKGKLEYNLDNYPWPDFEIERKYVIHEDRLLDTHFPPSTHLHTNFMIQGSRGCAFTCTYCLSGHSDVIYPGQRPIRARSADNLINEMQYRIKTWPTQLERVEFLDDLLPLNPRWVEDLGARYPKEVGLPFYGFTHPHTSKPETLKILADAGCKYLFMGIQSGSQRTQRRYYDRKHSKKAIMEAVRNIRDAGIRPMIDLIGYNPLETEADNLEGLDLLCDLPRPYGIVKINPMAFYDNFRIQDIAQREGIMDQLERPIGVHAYQAKFKPEFLFWEMLLTMAQFDGFSKDALMALAEDEHLRMNPDFLVETVEMLYKTTFMDGNPVVPKDDYVGYLRWRLKRIEDSRAYKTYQKIKRLRLVG